MKYFQIATFATFFLYYNSFQQEMENAMNANITDDDYHYYSEDDIEENPIIDEAEFDKVVLRVES